MGWKWKFWAANLGIFAGLSVFLSFLHLGNPHVCAWGLASAIYAIMTSIYIRKFIRPMEEESLQLALEAKSPTTAYRPLPEAPVSLVANQPGEVSGSLVPRGSLRPGSESSTRDRWLLLLGCLGLAASCGAFVAYIVISAKRHERLNAQSHWLGAVWAFMSAKWSLGLALAVNSHRKYLATACSINDELVCENRV